MLCILSELSAFAGPGFTYADSNHGRKEKKEKSHTAYSKAGNASQPWLLQDEFLAALFKQKSSTRRTRDLKWQLD